MLLMVWMEDESILVPTNPTTRFAKLREPLLVLCLSLWFRQVNIESTVAYFLAIQLAVFLEINDVPAYYVTGRTLLEAQARSREES